MVADYEWERSLAKEVCLNTGWFGVWNQGRCFVEAALMYEGLKFWTSIEGIPDK
jgi:hypothetical protein